MPGLSQKTQRSSVESRVPTAIQLLEGRFISIHYIRVQKYTYKHGHMHTYQQIYIHAHIHTYIQTYVHSFHFIFFISFHFFHFTFFIESKRKNSSKTKHKKPEQSNNVEHKAIILKDKRQEKSNTYCLMSVWITRFNREGLLRDRGPANGAHP